MNKPYIGRFAPSPTGPLHFGTLIAAVASYAQARSQNGQWLLRIEDVDTTRAIPGIADDMLATLKAFGFEWDGTVTYQAQRTKHYCEALQVLSEKNLVYPCTCSRKTLAEDSTSKEPSSVYPGTCRELKLAGEDSGNHARTGDHALRIRVNNTVIQFEDRVMGQYKQNLGKDCGDFILKRRDGLFAYQLAVVVDDALQGVTEVVRGADLLDSTPRQIYLQQQLGYNQPDYLHLPLVVNEHLQKISKSTAAPALNQSRPVPELCAALRHLGQIIPVELGQENLGRLWDWAIAHWDHRQIPKHHQRLPENMAE